MREVKSFINGEFLAPSDWVDTYNPVNGRVSGRYGTATLDDVDAAVRAARAALHGEWGKTGVHDRVDILHRIADGINDRFDEFLEAECLDTGKPYSLAGKIDIPRGAANFRIFADAIKNAADEAFHMQTPDGTGALKLHYTQAQRRHCRDWPLESAFVVMTWKVGPALACGNAVIVKPSEETPRTTSLLGEIMSEVGVPGGVFNVVLGRGSVVGNALIKNPGLDAITFTGSTATGRQVAEAAAIGARDVSLELGGKNPGVIFADCDMGKAVEGTLRSVFANCGQVCLGTERLYVEQSVFDQFINRLKAGAEALTMGEPDGECTDMGPLISRAHRDKVLAYYKQAEALGATVVCGGGVPEMPGSMADGYWVQPTIWTGLPEDSSIVREEIFGPCCHARPFNTEDEAIAMANDTSYGLAAAIWTENVSRAHRVAAQIDSGIWLGQQLVPARPAHPVWWYEGVRYRARRRALFTGILFGTQECLLKVVING